METSLPPAGIVTEVIAVDVPTARNSRPGGRPRLRHDTGPRPRVAVVDAAPAPPRGDRDRGDRRRCADRPELPAGGIREEANDEERLERGGLSRGLPDHD